MHPFFHEDPDTDHVAESLAEVVFKPINGAPGWYQGEPKAKMEADGGTLYDSEGLVVDPSRALMVKGDLMDADGVSLFMSESWAGMNQTLWDTSDTARQIIADQIVEGYIADPAAARATFVDSAREICLTDRASPAEVHDAHAGLRDFYLAVTDRPPDPAGARAALDQLGSENVHGMLAALAEKREESPAAIAARLFEAVRPGVRHFREDAGFTVGGIAVVDAATVKRLGTPLAEGASLDQASPRRAGRRSAQPLRI